MPVFPSVEWFRAVADLVNKDEEYHKLGYCDAEVGIKVGDQLYQLSFDTYEVRDIKQIASERDADLDFTLVMPPERWQAMLENIKEHGRAEHEWTLNTIDLGSPEEFAQADDYYRRDLFYRLNQSFQHFFDTSAKIDTKFATAARG